MRFAVEIASRGGTDVVIRWLLEGMKMDKQVLSGLLMRTLPRDLLRYLED